MGFGDSASTARTHTLRVEYDATRLNAAAVIQLVRSAGLQVVEEVQVALPAPVPEPAPAA